LRGGLLTIDQADLAMVTCHPGYTDECEVIAYAEKREKGIFIKKGLASGHLSYVNHADPITEAMQFIFSKPGVTSMIVGTLNPDHLRENVKKILAVTDRCNQSFF